MEKKKILNRKIFFYIILGLSIVVVNYLYLLNLENKKKSHEPFYRALKSNDKDLVLSFLEKGFNINKKPYKQVTPLVYACRYLDRDMVKLLLDHGADVHNRQKRIYPLRQAAMRGDLEILKLLLKYGADVHFRLRPDDKCNYMDPAFTAFEGAAAAGHVDIVRYLFENYNISEDELNNALIDASGFNQTDVMLFLFDNHSYKKSIINKALFEAVRCNNEYFEAVKVLIDKGADVNYVDGKYNVLAEAIYHKHFKTIKFLKEHGAKLNKRIN